MIECLETRLRLHSRMSRFSAWKAVAGILILTFVVSTPGCAVLRACFHREPPCQLSPNSSVNDIVDHLNQNITKLYSWRSTNVMIHPRAKGTLPVRLSAVIAVESPRNFRIMANSLAGSEVDFGSNAERLWFWNRRGEPQRILTASHEQIGNVQQRLNIPFQPDWLMEALGVIPIDGSRLVMQKQTTDGRIARLLSDHVSPQGQRVQKIIVVDTCHGLILEHVVYSASGQMIAKATFGDHQRDSVTGVILPRQISLNWPQAEMSLLIKLGNVEVNPPTMPTQTWQLPHYPNYPILDLGRN